MIISVASGKGGTGKTTVSLNLALAIKEPLNLLDVDVEEPNCHLFLPELSYISEKKYNIVPEINKDKCTYCGKCAEICQFNALAVLPEKTIVFKELCHSCEGCIMFCPEKAIDKTQIEFGTVNKAKYKNINFTFGELKIGYPMSPPLIKEVKSNIEKDKLNIIDCPPGTSCPAIEAVKDTDFCLLVSDPTPFGIHDLKLSIRALRYLKIPFGLVINRFDIADDILENYCKDEEIPVLLRIPDDRKIAEAYSKGKLMVDEIPEYRKDFQRLYKKIKELA